MLPLLPAYTPGELISYKPIGEHPDLPYYLVEVVGVNRADYTEHAVRRLHGADAGTVFWAPLSNLGPRQKLPLTRANVVQALRIAADGKPADYRYTDEMRLQPHNRGWVAGRGGSCFYFDPRVKDGESCMCLVGTMLHVLGYGPEDVQERQSASVVVGRIARGDDHLGPDDWYHGLTEHNRNTIRGLDEAQSFQDQGYTWPEAVRRYSQFIERKQEADCDRHEFPDYR